MFKNFEDYLSNIFSKEEIKELEDQVALILKEVLQKMLDEMTTSKVTITPK